MNRRKVFSLLLFSGLLFVVISLLSGGAMRRQACEEPAWSSARKPVLDIEPDSRAKVILRVAPYESDDEEPY